MSRYCWCIRSWVSSNESYGVDSPGLLSAPRRHRQPRRRLPEPVYVRSCTSCGWRSLTRAPTLSVDGSEPVNIVSLGAGFDTLLFRMIQSGSARNVNFVEVDCASIVAAKASTLRDRLSAFFPEDAVVDDDGSVGVESSVAFRYRIATSKTTAKYAMLACDLGDTTTLERGLKALEVDTTRPTLVIAECVVVRW